MVNLMPRFDSGPNEQPAVQRMTLISAAAAWEGCSSRDAPTAGACGCTGAGIVAALIDAAAGSRWTRSALTSTRRSLHPVIVNNGYGMRGSNRQSERSMCL